MHPGLPKSSCFHVVDWLKIEIPFSVLITYVTSRTSLWICSTDWLCVKQPCTYVGDAPCLKCWQQFHRTVVGSLLVCHSMTVLNHYVNFGKEKNSGCLLNQSGASGIHYSQIQGIICDYFTNEELSNRVTDTLTVMSALDYDYVCGYLSWPDLSWGWVQCCRVSLLSTVPLSLYRKQTTV